MATDLPDAVIWYGKESVAETIVTATTPCHPNFKCSRTCVKVLPPGANAVKVTIPTGEPQNPTQTLYLCNKSCWEGLVEEAIECHPLFDD